jgi:hypothetical protein
LEYLGRLDAQVKVRGHRIELGEIEAALAECAGVGQAAVVVQRADVADARLVAFIVPDREPGPVAAELRATLASRLPDYMVPSAFVVAGALPLLPNGKLDRKALSAADIDAASDSSEPPRTEVEAAVAGIWCDVLKRERVGVHDNFFELGGHSLSAILVISRIEQALAVDLGVRALFRTPTVAGLSMLIEQEHQTLRELVSSVAHLSDAEAEALLAGDSDPALLSLPAAQPRG